MRRVAWILVFAAACSARAPGGSASIEFRLGGRVATVRVEVASTQAARDRGLMGRRSLAPDLGMLFVWPSDGVRQFWMKDTLISLDLVSIEAGRVVAVQHMSPCPADPCPLTTTPLAGFILEVAHAVPPVAVGARATVRGL